MSDSESRLEAGALVPADKWVPSIGANLFDGDAN